MKPPVVTLYGQFNGHWSNAGVSRGLAAGLHANGVGLKLVGEQGLYECIWTLPRRVTRKPPDMELCAGVPRSEGIGMFVGYPPQAWAALQGHPVKVGAFICESEILPADWGAGARQCDLVVVPSVWVKHAYLAAGVLPDRLLVVPHGIHSIYQRAAPHMGARPFEAPGEGLAFLHVAGARDFIERKGTPQLIEAFARVFDPANGALRHQKALLVIRTPSNDRLVEMVKATGVPHLFHFDWHDAAFPPERMHTYLAGDWAAVIQPSRAEAFGLCLKRGTLITTLAGATKIEDVVVGDYVLTHRGGWQPVTGVVQRKKKHLLRVRAIGVRDLLLTKEHEVLVAGRMLKEKAAKVKPNLRWIPAGQLDKHTYLVLRGPSQQKRPVEIDLTRYTTRPVLFDDGTFSCRWGNGTTKNIHLPQTLQWSIELCRLIGGYVAEGSISAHGNCVSWALHTTKDVALRQEIIKAAQVFGHAVTMRTKGAFGIELFCSSSVLARMLRDLCGSGARNKKLPGAVWGLSHEERVALLWALLRGDGCVEDGALSYCTVSPVLATQVRDLWLSVGLPAGLHERRMPVCRLGSTAPIRRHGVIQKSSRCSYIIRVSGKWYESACALLLLTPKRTNRTKRRGSHFLQGPNGVWLVPVKHIKKERVTVPLHDLQVATDTSYVANGVVVHNCPVEARASGLPVIQTRCSGHAAHAEERDVVIASGPVGPIAVQGIPNGLAPTVTADAIVVALQQFVLKAAEYKSVARLRTGGYAVRYSWGLVTTPLAARLRELSSGGRTLAGRTVGR